VIPRQQSVLSCVGLLADYPWFLLAGVNLGNSALILLFSSLLFCAILSSFPSAQSLFMLDTWLIGELALDNPKYPAVDMGHTGLLFKLTRWKTISQALI
jgi:hypothetical protein